METLALTFDDGPDPLWTPRLLDALDRRQARATFFPIASRATRFPNLIARMLDAGHEIGVHCDQHVRHSEQSRDAVTADVLRATDQLARLGVTPRLWRTPWGDQAAFTADVAAERGLRLIGWTVDTHDWRGDSSAEMFRTTRHGLIDGAVVLAHDGIGPGARRVNIAATIQYTKRVIGYARGAGLALGVLG